MKVVRLSIKQTKDRARLAVLLAALCFTIFLWFEMIASAYALTLSFGDGYGFVYHCPSYYELPEVLRESVDVHENDHLQFGTVFKGSRTEVHAYTAQIEDIERKIKLLKQRLLISTDPAECCKLRLDIIYLKLFERDARACLQEYRSKLGE